MFTLVFAALALAAPVPPEGADVKELKALQGRWKGVAAEERGDAGPIEDVDHCGGFVAEGTALTIQSKGRKGERHTIKFDRTKSPGHLDLTRQSKEGSPDVCRAIYKLEGGRLTICFAGYAFAPSAADERPTEFKAGSRDQQPAKGRLMYVFERVKD